MGTRDALKVQHIVDGLRAENVVGEHIETGLSHRSPKASLSSPISSPSPSNAHTKITRSHSPSVASTCLGSLLARPRPVSHGQPVTEGRIKIKSTIDCGCDVLCAQWSVDGSMLAVALRTGYVRVCAPNGQTLFSLSPPRCLIRGNDEQRVLENEYWPEYTALMQRYMDHPAATSLNWHPLNHETLITTYSDGQILCWKIGESNCWKSSVAVSKTNCGIDVKAKLAQVAGEHTLITFTRHAVQLRRLTDLSIIVQCKPQRPAGCSLPEADSIFAVGGRSKDIIGGGNRLTWWDARSGDVKRVLSDVCIQGGALAIHPTSNKMVTGAWGGRGGSVKIWEVSTGKEIAAISSENYSTCVKSVAWCGKDLIAIGGTDQNILRIVTLDNTTVGAIRDLRHAVMSIEAFAPRNQPIYRLATTAGQLVYVADLPK